MSDEHEVSHIHQALIDIEGAVAKDATAIRDRIEARVSGPHLSAAQVKQVVEHLYGIYGSAFWWIDEEIVMNVNTGGHSHAPRGRGHR